MNSILGTLFAATSVLAISHSSPSIANKPDIDSKYKAGPCATDVSKRCGTIKPGEGRVHLCLTEKHSQVPEACQKFKGSQEFIPKEVREACRGDVRAHCKDTRPGRGRFLGCLRQNEGKVSTGCREAIKKMPPPKK